MAKQPKTWITINGVHVPIFEGDTKQDAFNRSIAMKNEAIKAKQIAKSKEQAEQLNQKPLPRRLDLPNIPAEKANETSDVLHLKTKQRFKFKDGTKITQVLVFAGKGCSKEFRDAAKYAKRWGGKAEDWQHCSGKAQITDGKRTFVREVHWVQGADGKMHEAFIKVHENNLEKRK